MNSDPSTQRNRVKFRVNYEQSEESIYYNELKLFGDLPNEIKDLNTLNEFKNKCWTFVRSNFPIM